MTTRKLITLACVAALLLGLTGTAAAGRWHRHDGIDGSGDAETRRFDLDGFDSVRLDTGMNMEIRVGEKFEVEIVLDDNLFEHLDVEVRGDRLVIGSDEDIHPDAESLLRLSLPELESLQINGAGDVTIEGFDGGDFHYELQGAGDLELDGKLDRLEIDLKGAGSVEAYDLKAKKADVAIYGAGDVECWAEDEIRAVVHGVGEITFKGDPAKQRTSVHGIGSIDAR